MASPKMEFKPNAAYDIFPTIATYLDPHLVIPILDSDFYKNLQVSRMECCGIDCKQFIIDRQ